MADQGERLIKAIKQGEHGTAAGLIEQNPALVNARSADGVSALLWSIYYGRKTITALLLGRLELDLNLFEAAASGQIEAVQALIEADPELVNGFAPDGFQPLGLAAFFGHAAVVDLLLDHGAEPNSSSRNSQRVAPLHSAAAGGHLEIARRLLERGADPNRRQAGGFTPLHSAAQNGQRAMIELLLARGAERSPRTDDGRTPLDLALAAGHEGVRPLLA